MSNTPLNSAATTGGNKGPLPLEGITVVSLEHAIAAPFCTRQLADMGSRVSTMNARGGWLRILSGRIALKRA